MTRHRDELHHCPPEFGTRPNIVPFNVPSINILLSLLNKHLNPRGSIIPLTLDQVEFGVPVALPSTDLRDTSITVTGKPAGGFKGTFVLYYDRMGFAEFFADKLPIISVNSPLYTWDLLPSINRTYDLALGQADVLNLPIQGSSHRVIANPGSYVWNKNVVLTLAQLPDSPPVDITQSITVLTLSGFGY